MDLQTMIDELDAELGRSGGKKKAALPRIPQHVMDAAARPFPASPGVQEQAFDAMRTPIEGASYLARGATRLMTDPLGAARDALGTAWDATGIPMMAEGVQQAYRGATEGNALLAAGGAGKTVLGALPGASLVRGARPVVNALAGSVPRAMLTLGGLGALSGAADAGEAARAQQPPDLLPSLMEDRARIQQELQRYTAIKGQNASRPGPKYREAERQIMMLEPKLQAIDAQIQEEQRKRSPEYLREQREKEAAMPFRERYPEIAGALPALGFAAAAGLPFALRGTNNLRSFFYGEAPRLSRTTRAVEQGLSPLADNLELRTAQLGARLSEAERKGVVKRELVPALLAGASGATLAAEGSMFPSQYDAYNLPPGPTRDAARREALDPMAYIERGAMGLLTGLGGYEAAGMIPKAIPDFARARGALDVANKQLGTAYGPPTRGQRMAPPQPAPPAVPPQNPGMQGASPGRPLYPPSGSPERQQIQDAYRGAVLKRGQTVEPQEASDIIKRVLGQQGIAVPSSRARVEVTNDLIRKFQQQHGRLPQSKAEWSAFVYATARGLAAPAAIGVNALAGAYSQPEE